ncbi:hypothetical protein AVEN_244668-1 [Araneus ventricosus]|uniref:Uncharacterized protein n=1 Tax=Araneus ventricosus TaxID=182803 RepID=A0A4Y2KI46_ARAVE|nr:hypothetical protein AVEN_244668-1 [Araneus ventricosus]
MIEFPANITDVDFDVLTDGSSIDGNVGHRPICICGGLEDADHFAFDCPHTAEFHFACPIVLNKPAWFSNALNNNSSVLRMESVLFPGKSDDLSS